MEEKMRIGVRSSIEIDGQRKTVREWANEVGIDENLIVQRFNTLKWRGKDLLKSSEDVVNEHKRKVSEGIKAEKESHILKDCIHYNGKNCNALTKLYCSQQSKCNFYKTER